MHNTSMFSASPRQSDTPPLGAGIPRNEPSVEEILESLLPFKLPYPEKVLEFLKQYEIDCSAPVFDLKDARVRKILETCESGRAITEELCGDAHGRIASLGIFHTGFRAIFIHSENTTDAVILHEAIHAHHDSKKLEYAPFFQEGIPTYFAAKFKQQYEPELKEHQLVCEALAKELKRLAFWPEVCSISGWLTTPDTPVTSFPWYYSRINSEGELVAQAYAGSALAIEILVRASLLEEKQLLHGKQEVFEATLIDLAQKNVMDPKNLWLDFTQLQNHQLTDCTVPGSTPCGVINLCWSLTEMTRWNC